MDRNGCASCQKGMGCLNEKKQKLFDVYYTGIYPLYNFYRASNRYCNASWIYGLVWDGGYAFCRF